MKLLNTGVSFPSDGAWQHLGILSTLRSISSGVPEIHIRYINKLSSTLRLQLCVLFDIRQSSGSYNKVSTTDRLENQYLYTFPTTDK